jgi:hypothetical protein
MELFFTRPLKNKNVCLYFFSYEELGPVSDSNRRKTNRSKGVKDKVD